MYVMYVCMSKNYPYSVTESTYKIQGTTKTVFTTVAEILMTAEVSIMIMRSLYYTG